MNKNSIINQVNKFIARNQEAVENYETLFEGLCTVEDAKIEIVDILAESKIPIAHQYGILESALQTAISDTMVITDALVDTIESLDDIDDTKNVYARTNTYVSKKPNYTSRYFNRISKLYDDLDLLHIDPFKATREELILSNTKMVISVAKRYQGLGVHIDDLVSAGNLGLCSAWERYDKNKDNLKSKLLKLVNEFQVFPVTGAQIKNKFCSVIKYGKLLEQVYSVFEDNKTYSQKFIKEWIEKHIKPAKFSSVCMLWIKAYILTEINENSRPIKPKSGFDKKNKTKREEYISLDSYAYDKDGENRSFSEIIGEDDDFEDKIDEQFLNKELNKTLNKLFEGISSRDRSVICKLFGIGVPEPIPPKELARLENTSSARISQLQSEILNTMRQNATKYNIDMKSVEALLPNV